MSSLEDTEPISKAACTYDFLISKQDSFDSYAGECAARYEKKISIFMMLIF